MRLNFENELPTSGISYGYSLYGFFYRKNDSVILSGFVSKIEKKKTSGLAETDNILRDNRYILAAALDITHGIFKVLVILNLIFMKRQESYRVVQVIGAYRIVLRYREQRKT